MFRYEYVTVGVGSNGLKGAITISSEFTEHRVVINEYARRGYRYVGFIPRKMTDSGRIKTIDLIFETNKE